MTKTQDVSFKLMMPAPEAAQKIGNLITEWKAVKDLRVDNESAFERARKMSLKWSDYHRALLRRVFESAEVADEYSGSEIDLEPSGATLYAKITELGGQIDRKVDSLEAVMDLLKTVPAYDSEYTPVREPAVSSAPVAPAAKGKMGKYDIFISQGHDETGEGKVAAFMQRLGLTPVVVQENLDGKGSRMEKRGDGDVGFGVVILTPDDEGRKKGETDLHDRVGQNVLLELGYLMGLLGRKNVCALYKASVELPLSDLGILLVPFDDSDDYWQLKLAKELKITGFPVDMNKAV